MSRNHLRYTREDLISILKDISIEKNKRPSQLDLKRGVHPTANTFVNCFGSWQNALTASGFGEVKHINREYTKEYLAEELRRYIETYDKVPTITDLDSKEDFPTSHYYIKMYGSFKEALFQNGYIKERYRQRKYSSNELIQFLIKFKKEYDVMPDSRGLDEDHNYPSYLTFRKHFGTFKKALEEAELLESEKEWYFRKYKYNKEKIISIIHDFYNKNGRPPCGKDFNINPNYPSSPTIISHFGGVNNAVKEAGYTPIYEAPTVLSNEELIENLKTLYQELGVAPSKSDIDNCSYTSSYSSYYSRFGGYYEILNKANIPFKEPYSWMLDIEIIEAWKQIVNENDRFPNRDMLEEYGIRSEIYSRWGNYKEFLLQNNLPITKESYGFRNYYTSNGTLCLSDYELLITQYLEDNKVPFDKEVKYKDVIKSDNTNRRFDWVIYSKGKSFYVEMFGIENNKKYDEKIKNKITTCKENGIDLICIYPEDFDEGDYKSKLGFLKPQQLLNT